MTVTRIDQFMSKIGKQRGMSLTTGFDVVFELPVALQGIEYYNGTNEEVVTMLCDEAQLPNVQTATGQMSGRYLGESAVQYPHSRMFTDVGLGFLCDADLVPLKFFNRWYEFMFSESKSPQNGSDFFSARNSFAKIGNRPNRLKYQDEYAANVKIIKTEPDATAANGRAPITYILENAYPYAIDAVPLSYGTSQITRVNVNFHYSRHTVVYSDKYGKSSGTMLSQNFVDTGGDLNLQSSTFS